MDEDGFVPLPDLLKALRKRFDWVDEEIVLRIVRESPKKRFEIKNGKIRAIYGHSIKGLNISYPPYIPTGNLYHGTTPWALDGILREGIKPMGRLWVHLSLSPEDAISVALRRTDEPVILSIDAVRAYRDGLEFFWAKEVILTKEVPVKYIIDISTP